MNSHSTSTTQPSRPSAAGPAFQTIDAQTVNRWLSDGEAVLIDVREPDEHARERIAGTIPMPLSRFDPGALAPLRDRKIIMHCKGGHRSADACAIAASSGPAGIDLYSLGGGIDAWKKQNLPVDVNTTVSRISVLRQVQIVVGTLVLAGSALAWFTRPEWIVVPAFFGAGLLFAGSTGFCGLAAVLSRMPWNNASAKC